MELPFDIVETVLGHLNYNDLCKMRSVSHIFQNAAYNFAENFKKFHKGATLQYECTRNGRRMYWRARGVVRIVRVMPKMIEYQHADRSGFVTRQRKRARCNSTRGVLEFELGNCGVRYGGTGLKFASDDSRWKFL